MTIDDSSVVNSENRCILLPKKPMYWAMKMRIGFHSTFF
jgi:hypothetical protein